MHGPHNGDLSHTFIDQGAQEIKMFGKVMKMAVSIVVKPIPPRQMNARIYRSILGEALSHRIIEQISG